MMFRRVLEGTSTEDAFGSLSRCELVESTSG
jgi:hypothetical protein